MEVAPKGALPKEGGHPVPVDIVLSEYAVSVQGQLLPEAGLERGTLTSKKRAHLCYLSTVGLPSEARGPWGTDSFSSKRL